MTDNAYFCVMLKRKNSQAKRLIRKGLIITAALGVVYSCASIGRPDGGPYDDTPPRFIGSTPDINATNSNKKKVVLEFDEFIKLEKPGEKVVFSPPQIKQPEIKPSGKKIAITYMDTFKLDATYTIDFSDAIVDNNEGNPLGDFSFSFSTGEVIDTMEVSGYVLEASNLEPVKGILVGLHTNLEDSAFTKLPFDRVSRTDSRGKYTIRGVAPGTYRIFALMDADQNYAFSQKSEMIAFHDSLVIPRFESRFRQDTTWVDSLTVDTVIEREYTHYLPDDIVLRAFKEEPVMQYLEKNERLEPHKFSFYFSNKADTLPILKGLNFDEKDAFIVEHSQRNDTLHYWIKDSLIYQRDTLQVSLTYLHTDTLNQLVPRTDTLNLAMRKVWNKDGESEQKKKRRGRKNEEEEEEKIEFLKMNVQAPSAMDVYGQVTISFEEPGWSYDREAIHLKHKVDTLWYDVPFEIEEDSLDIKKMILYTEWEPEVEYELSIDSLGFTGLYGLHSDKMKQTFKVRSLDDYGTIYFNIKGAGPSAFVELLDGKDGVLRTIQVEEGKADFYFLNPGQYGARLVNDRNGNGVWDTGNYEEGLQPEEVYYYFQVLEVRTLMTLEQNWDVTSPPLERQKPEVLTKQKPDEPKKRTNTNQNRTNRK